ncbi:hypothetical protein M5K25_021707 [Dendrobium thyrsiflorum]|uniref:Uncharacterized protein n=1 Tax=Dendrobium thyrsiflorum TaxID=117978 RepID=A0ABD0U4V6_DENTH
MKSAHKKRGEGMEFTNCHLRPPSAQNPQSVCYSIPTLIGIAVPQKKAEADLSKERGNPTAAARLLEAQLQQIKKPTVTTQKKPTGTRTNHEKITKQQANRDKKQPREGQQAADCPEQKQPREDQQAEANNTGNSHGKTNSSIPKEQPRGRATCSNTWEANSHPQPRETAQESKGGVILAERRKRLEAETKEDKLASFPRGEEEVEQARKLFQEEETRRKPTVTTQKQPTGTRNNHGKITRQQANRDKKQPREGQQADRNGHGKTDRHRPTTQKIATGRPTAASQKNNQGEEQQAATHGRQTATHNHGKQPRRAKIWARAFLATLELLEAYMRADILVQIQKRRFGLLQVQNNSGEEQDFSRSSVGRIGIQHIVFPSHGTVEEPQSCKNIAEFTVHQAAQCRIPVGEFGTGKLKSCSIFGTGVLEQWEFGSDKLKVPALIRPLQQLGIRANVWKGKEMMDRGKETRSEEVRSLDSLWANQDNVNRRLDELSVEGETTATKDDREEPPALRPIQRRGAAVGRQFRHNLALIPNSSDSYEEAVLYPGADLMESGDEYGEVALAERRKRLEAEMKEERLASFPRRKEEEVEQARKLFQRNPQKAKGHHINISHQDKEPAMGRPTDSSQQGQKTHHGKPTAAANLDRKQRREGQPNSRQTEAGISNGKTNRTAAERTQSTHRKTNQQQANSFPKHLGKRNKMTRNKMTNTGEVALAERRKRLEAETKEEKLASIPRRREEEVEQARKLFQRNSQTKGQPPPSKPIRVREIESQGSPHKHQPPGQGTSHGKTNREQLTGTENTPREAHSSSQTWTENSHGKANRTAGKPRQESATGRPTAQQSNGHKAPTGRPTNSRPTVSENIWEKGTKGQKDTGEVALAERRKRLEAETKEEKLASIPRRREEEVEQARKLFQRNSQTKGQPPPSKPIRVREIESQGSPHKHQPPGQGTSHGKTNREQLTGTENTPREAHSSSQTWTENSHGKANRTAGKPRQESATGRPTAQQSNGHKAPTGRPTNSRPTVSENIWEKGTKGQVPALIRPLQQLPYGTKNYTKKGDLAYKVDNDYIPGKWEGSVVRRTEDTINRISLPMMNKVLLEADQPESTGFLKMLSRFLGLKKCRHIGISPQAAQCGSKFRLKKVGTVQKHCSFVRYSVSRDCSKRRRKQIDPARMPPTSYINQSKVLEYSPECETDVHWPKSSSKFLTENHSLDPSTSEYLSKCCQNFKTALAINVSCRVKKNDIKKRDGRQPMIMCRLCSWTCYSFGVLASLVPWHLVLSFLSLSSLRKFPPHLYLSSQAFKGVGWLVW